MEDSLFYLNGEYVDENQNRILKWTDPDTEHKFYDENGQWSLIDIGSGTPKMTLVSPLAIVDNTTNSCVVKFENTESGSLKNVTLSFEVKNAVGASWEYVLQGTTISSDLPKELPSGYSQDHTVTLHTDYDLGYERGLSGQVTLKLDSNNNDQIQLIIGDISFRATGGTVITPPDLV